MTTRDPAIPLRWVTSGKPHKANVSHILGTGEPSKYRAPAVPVVCGADLSCPDPEWSRPQLRRPKVTMRPTREPCSRCVRSASRTPGLAGYIAQDVINSCPVTPPRSHQYGEMRLA